MPPTTFLTALAQEGAGRDEINAVVAGVGAFILLTILLIITLQFNRDR